MNLSKEKLVEKVVNDFLEEDILETLLDKLDIQPHEVILCALNNGLIDEEVLKTFLLSDLV